MTTKKYTQEQFNKIPEFRKQLKTTQNEICRLVKIRNALQQKVQDLEQITEFYEGVPLYIWLQNPNGEIAEIDISSVPDCDRIANIHQSNIPISIGTWGITLYDFKKPRGETDVWTDPSGRTKEAALEIGKEWVAKGVMPK
jgi:hypothetical protein